MQSKKAYREKDLRTPEIEKVTLESAEPVTAWLGLAGNPFAKLAFEDEERTPSCRPL